MAKNTQFRAWDKFNENMTFSYLTTLTKFFNNLDRLIGGGNEIILMQFTRLIDKNSQWIYEGDVISIWLSAPYDEDIPVLVKGIVEWDERFGHYKFNSGNLEYDDNIYEYGNSFELLGNIYENPELLEAKNFIEKATTDEPQSKD